jgi:hypothetical protein
MPTVFGTLRWQTVPRTLLKAYTMKLTAKAVQTARYQGKVTKLLTLAGYTCISRNQAVYGATSIDWPVSSVFTRSKVKRCLIKAHR